MNRLKTMSSLTSSNHQPSPLSSLSEKPSKSRSQRFHHLGEVKIPAAWLLDELGWRGKRVGDAAVSHKHALIIINNGNATGKDIMNLAGEMSATVYDRYGISLKPEVKIIDS